MPLWESCGPTPSRPPPVPRSDHCRYRVVAHPADCIAGRLCHQNCSRRGPPLGGGHHHSDTQPWVRYGYYQLTSPRPVNTSAAILDALLVDAQPFAADRRRCRTRPTRSHHAGDRSTGPMDGRGRAQISLGFYVGYAKHAEQVGRHLVRGEGVIEVRFIVQRLSESEDAAAANISATCGSARVNLPVAMPCSMSRSARGSQPPVGMKQCRTAGEKHSAELGSSRCRRPVSRKLWANTSAGSSKSSAS